MSVGMSIDSLFLGEDKILELLQLCSHPVQLVHLMLNVEVWLLILLSNRQQTFGIGVCGDLVRKA